MEEKDWRPKRVTIYFPIFYLVKSSDNNWFPSWVSKFSSVRNKLNLTMRYWLMEANIVFCVWHGPEKGSKYHLETIQTTFSEINNYYEEIFVKINFFHAWKCIISGVKYRSMFWHLIRKSALLFSKWLFFQNSLVISLAT